MGVATGLCALLAGCAGGEPFTSRVPLGPLLAKLAASGGDEGRIIHARTAGDLAALASGQRYKFVLLADGSLAIAPLPADATNNEYVHPVLAHGAAVRTAGGITVERAGDAIARVTIDQDSKAYCPSRASLDAARAALGRMGLAAEQVVEVDRPPACVPPGK